MNHPVILGRGASLVIASLGTNLSPAPWKWPVRIEWNLMYYYHSTIRHLSYNYISSYLPTSYYHSTTPEMMNRLHELQIRRMDRVLEEFKPLSERRTPPSGWLKTVRETLGMSIRQLAERTGLSKTSVASAEKSEEKGAIQMDTLRQIADGLNCDIVYAIVPRTSLRNMVDEQARKKAEGFVGRVSDSMELEAQEVPDPDRRREIEELMDELIRNRGRDFWDD